MIIISILLFILFINIDAVYKDLFQNNVILHVKSGIGDKILSLLGILVFSSYTNMKATIYWGAESDSRMYDMRLLDFSNFDNVKWELDDRKKREYTFGELEIRFAPYHVHEYFKDKYTMKEISDKYIEYGKQIKPGEIIKKYIPEKLSDYIAVHLRRTDKIGDVELSSYDNSLNEYEIILNKSIEYIEEYIKTHDNNKFYIISDDYEYKNEYINKINKSNKEVEFYMTSKDDLPNEINNDYKNAYDIYEFFSMSKCKMIIQVTKHSTYSLAAALISEAKLINFSKHQSNWLTLGWKPCLNITIEGKEYERVHDIDELNNLMATLPGSKITY